MTPSETLTLATYFFVLVILAVYGWYRYYLVYLYMKNKDKMPVPAGPMAALPVVTVQLPIYNEYVRGKAAAEIGERTRLSARAAANPGAG